MEIYNVNEKDKRVSSPQDLQKKAVTLNLTKVYLWFAYGLALTGGMAMGWPYIVSSIWGSGQAGYDVFLSSLIAYGIIAIVFALLSSFAGLSKKSWIIGTFYTIFAIAMGGVLSSAVVYFARSEGNLNTLLYAFLVTAGSFMIMGFLGIFTKGKIGVFLPFLISFLFGVALISLFNLLFFRGSTYFVWYWVISIGILALYLVVAAVDINRIYRIAAQRGFENDNTLAIYCAYNLYADFIIIFMYILRIFAASKR